MVRVAGLKRRIATGLAVPSPAGRSPIEVLEQISDAAHELQARHAHVFADQIRPALAYEHIHLVHWNELDEAAKAQLSAMFAEKVFPILTPLAVDPAHPFPYISGLSLNLAVVVRNPVSDKELFARLKVPDQLPRLVSVDGPRAGTVPGRVARFIPLEEVIAEHLDQLFQGMEVLEHHTFRVTRNEDLEVEEDDAENLLQALEKELLRRRFGPPVRLEVTTDINPNIRSLLVRELGVEDSEVYALPAPLDLRGLSVIGGIDRSDLRYPRHVAHTSRYLNESETAKAANVFAAMRRRDILLHHPYDSFSTSVQAFLEQAAADPKVQAIKQTLYRTSGDSPIVDALVDAAEAGKQVLALVEIKARFDEQANISWARKLEQAGVHVVYGIVGLKTHCKLSLVVRQELDGLRRYCHIGTGNYHPRTARYYEDLGLLTADNQVGEDLSKLFNQLSGYAPKSTFKRLLVAPRSVRSGLIDRIEREIANRKAGLPGKVQIKVNSMVDEAIIDSLYRASQAGVQVDIIVRGICSLRPGVPGLSENITVRSVLGRFLEHSRVFAFANAGDPVVYIGSADMMHRNLDRRVEALVQLRNAEDIADLLALLDRYVDPGTASWHLDHRGAWTRHHLDEADQPLLDVQSWLLASRSRQRMAARR
jgi:polyphosphate kinase